MDPGLIFPFGNFATFVEEVCTGGLIFKFQTKSLHFNFHFGWYIF